MLLSVHPPRRCNSIASVEVEKDDNAETKIWSCCDGTDTLCGVNKGQNGSSPVGMVLFTTD